MKDRIKEINREIWKRSIQFIILSLVGINNTLEWIILKILFIKQFRT